MLKYLLIGTCLLMPLSTKAVDYAYFGFEPDIVTNYIPLKKKMGYVRLTVELMVPSQNIEIVEHHSALLRDAIIDIIGKQPEEKIKSIKGRAEILLKCEEKVKELLTQETGQPLIKKLLFTQWLDN
ncbi:flagellar basal body-associated FliL family protein [Colwellia sp. 4_MG-2023]|jgi:flagellar FliL protein|uniref:flagellar basal body-associated FliL family protein n=2 Tax=unclassified Colwellia TaxID=196834 RepID=UPI001C094BA6|nr:MULTISPECIES: flagellar basal body-associated FliL family protein [unclassified Colwellia]MDO6486285.1 flagellar basal body-associated FliL family protein [Colwellia sp. 6_MG-2023]MDO6664633.1 flagellar basal body-associated FliL family protein [Colwellia sp. 2_MG-2023]MBU2923702.1 flagellar basal body-associated protein FliL [Colwellia sp. C2M11]MDO6505775.1 flagellar basal body-associated FliL family protein [Colwellia sp. 5_MG-2023]MDO6554456.1 flagellar basal body-associated FliL family